MLEMNLSNPDWALTVPQLIVFGLAMVLLFADAFLPRALHYVWLTIASVVGYGAALVALYWQDGQNDSTFNGLFRADGLTVFLPLAILPAALPTALGPAPCIESP